ncbi:MAG: MmgE/PrpD family protein, partial [Acetobacteraceae bacterium]
MSGLIERMAEYAQKERDRALPEPVLHHARRALIDWFAALLPGTIVPPAIMLARALGAEMQPDGTPQGKPEGKPEGKPTGAIVYANARRSNLRTAALINGAAAHTAEFDDIFRDAVYHPGSAVIAAALAAAQARHADGETLLRAIVIGYEVSTRIGVAVMPSHYRFWHTTGTIGTFGAAAAVASVMALDADQFAHALATAATFAAGLKVAFRSEAMSKPLHPGHAAEAGALAALAAGEGVTGALDVLDGPGGFGEAMSDGADWEAALDGLGERHNISLMTFKNHGCCGHIFAAIDAMLALRAKHHLLPEDVARVRIGTYRVALEVTDRSHVASAFEGRFSTQFCTASALVHGSVRLDAFRPERLADPRVQALMPRIGMAVDSECDARFPGRRSAVVEIETVDGRRLRHFQPTRKGDPEAPLTDRELDDKFFELATPVIGRASAATLLASLRALGRGDGVQFLAARP